MRLSDIHRNEITDAASVRAYIVDALRRELVGPDPGHPFVQWDPRNPLLSGEEVLRPQDPPRFRYACGILFPNGVRYSGSEAPTTNEEVETLDAFTRPVEINDPPKGGEDDEGGDGEGPEEEAERSAERDAEPDVDQTSLFLPSTMGISFLISGDGPLRVSAEWATYVQAEFQHYAAGGAQNSRAGKVWLRRPSKVLIEFSPKELSEATVVTRRRRVTSDGQSPVLELDLVSRGRPSGDEEQRLLTLTLMNTTPGSGDVNQNCLFQCRLSAEPGHGLVVERYPEGDEALLSSEELRLKLLYRQNPVYGVGHGCAADWTLRDDGKVARIHTEVLPVFEQPPIVPRDVVLDGDADDEEIPVLSMRKFAESGRVPVVEGARLLADQYRLWITRRRCEADDDRTMSDGLLRAAHENLDACLECLQRIEQGIEVLDRDDLVFDAFRLMNRAMLEQREHYALGSNDKTRRSWTKTDAGQLPDREFAAPPYPYETKWRPFQLAFILMNLASFADPTTPQRDLVDIIWFPTGGGKTEAYLGLAAFVILLRRMRNPDNVGTTVLMRYTLRLLTTQQFQRAASLICALELIRRERPGVFGREPITIGLWLGSAVTPNRNQQAIEEWNKLARGDDENKFVVLSCPWCGVDMGPREYGEGTRIFGYEKQTRPAQVRFRCEDHGCAFSTDAGLPLEVVDERIYERPSSLIVGTVDKFAMLPWETNARSLFGRAPGQANDPPELVIQDELHLISGPLGSMVGHYETIIDALCDRRAGSATVGPKIVASTATIARAEEQVMATFARKARLFPPQGLRASDSFFAEERRDLTGRKYVGVFANALPSHVTAQVFTTAVLLQAPALLQPPVLIDALADDFRDPYWTLMTYFNSLRELGRAATLVQADIRERLNAVWDRIGLTVLMSNLGDPAKALRRFIDRHEELTSRVRSSDVPAILQKLFTAYPDDKVIDLCLATNMIQVGLDVPRLSIMTIVGQPKTTSEYIQASSRVGRSVGKPGLVVTNLNPFKPRDRSHFESFRSFHESIYRHVEPTSVTPFSIPVCQRAIHALAVALARCLDPTLVDTPQSGIPPATRTQIEKIILRRVRVVAPDEFDNARVFLATFLDGWDRVRPQYYGSFSHAPPPGVEPMLWPAGKPRPDHTWQIARDTPSSMRSVDAECEAWSLREYPGGPDS